MLIAVTDRFSLGYQMLKELSYIVVPKRMPHILCTSYRRGSDNRFIQEAEFRIRFTNFEYSADGLLVADIRSEVGYETVVVDFCYSDLLVAGQGFLNEA